MNRRRCLDIAKLKLHDFDVYAGQELFAWLLLFRVQGEVSNNAEKFIVLFHGAQRPSALWCNHTAGPANTVYAHGTWRVRVELHMDYPYRTPNVGFVDKIFHPNVDAHSGVLFLLLCFVAGVVEPSYLTTGKTNVHCRGLFV